MEKEINFHCMGEKPEILPQVISQETGYSFSQIYSEKKAMAAAAAALRQYQGSALCVVPFCVTIEAEALGAKVRIKNNNIPPSVEGNRLSKAAELEGLAPMDITAGRLREVLDCVKILSLANLLALKICGPFTVLSLLLDLKEIFKGLNSQKKLIETALEKIEEGLLSYALAGIGNGARIISFAEPTGGPEIVGPKIYQSVCGKASFNFLKKLEKHLGGGIVVHLCGRTSLALEKTGCLKAESIGVKPDLKYAEAVSELLKSPDVKFIGHGCLNNLGQPMAEPVLWKLELL